jgi:hypothetical protein
MYGSLKGYARAEVIDQFTVSSKLRIIKQLKDTFLQDYFTDRANSKDLISYSIFNLMNGERKLALKVQNRNALCEYIAAGAGPSKPGR